MYNPYYALVCQYLCRQSHSHKITVQFGLWDFLRDLGEKNVGGAEVVRNAQDDNVAFDESKMSKSRWKNVARAYGWWIAKDGVSLNILKVYLPFICLSSDTLIRMVIASRLYIPQTHNARIHARSTPRSVYQQPNQYTRYRYKFH